MLNRFSYNEYSFENATCFTVVDAPAAVECSRQFNQNPRANVKVGQPANLPPTTTSIVVANYVGFNAVVPWVLDKPFARLETLEVGNNCFLFLTTVSIRGLPRLASVVIGEKSFTAWTKWTRPPNAPRAAHFLLENCPKLQSLAIARYSFSDSNDVAELITLTLGEKGTGARCFAHAPLSITGGCLLCFSSPDLPTLDHITFGRGCFQFSQHSTIASSSFVASPH